jgi:hypothetical protein
VLAANERVAHPDPPSGPVDVAPAQPQELGLAKPRNRGGEDQDPKHGSEDVGRRRRRGAWAATARQRGSANDHIVRDRADHRVQLVDRQELQIGVHVASAAAPGPGRVADRVLVDQAALERVLEDRM